jgi:hypothetical protein
VARHLFCDADRKENVGVQLPQQLYGPDP